MDVYSSTSLLSRSSVLPIHWQHGFHAHQRQNQLFFRDRRFDLDHLPNFRLDRVTDRCCARPLRGSSALDHLGLCGLNGLFNNLQLWNPNCFLNDLRLWDFNVLGHLVDFLIDDVLLSLLCLFDDVGYLCFDCVDNVLNMCVHNVLRFILRPSDRYLNDILSE